MNGVTSKRLEEKNQRMLYNQVARLWQVEMKNRTGEVRQAPRRRRYVTNQNPNVTRRGRQKVRGNRRRTRESVNAGSTAADAQQPGTGRGKVLAVLVTVSRTSSEVGEPVRAERMR